MATFSKMLRRTCGNTKLLYGVDDPIEGKIAKCHEATTDSTLNRSDHVAAHEPVPGPIASPNAAQ